MSNELSPLKSETDFGLELEKIVEEAFVDKTLVGASLVDAIETSVYPCIEEQANAMKAERLRGN